MSAQGITYDWTVEGKIPGVVEAISKIDIGTASMGKLEVATKSFAATTKASVDSLESLTAAHFKQANAKSWLTTAQAALTKKSMEFTTVVQAGEKATKEVPKQLSEGFKGVGHSIDSAKSSLTGFLEFTGAMVAFEVLKKITEGVMDLGSEILKSAGNAEKMALSLKLNVGVEGAKEVHEWIGKISSKTAFTSDQLEAWSNKLLGSGVAMNKVTKYLAAGLDLHAKGGDMESAVNALGTASLKGEIGTKQLLALGIGVNQVAELPGYKGLSKDALNKKIDAGNLSIPDLFKLIAGKDNVIGDQGVQEGNLLPSKLKNLKSLPDEYFGQFANSPAYEKMKTKLDDMFNALAPDTERGKRIFASMEKMLTVLVDGLTKIDFEKVANGLEKLFKVLFKLADLTGTAVSGTARGMGAAASAAGSTFDVVAAPTKFIMGKLFGDSEASGGKIAAGLAKGIENKTPVVGNAAEGMVDEADRMVREAAMIQSPSKLFEGHGKNVALGFAKGVDGGQASIDVAMGDAFSVAAPGGGRTVSAGAMGSPQIKIEVNVSGRGGQSDEDLGRTVAAEVSRVFPGALIDAFEQMGLAAGAA